jgi:hypothetical protein
MNSARIRILLIGLLTALLSTSVLYAQKQGVKNLPYVDQRRVHYGFALGITMADVNFMHTGLKTEDGGAWYAESPACNPSFCVGLLGDLALTEHVNLRCTPMFSFQTRDLEFRHSVTAETKTQNLKTAYLQLPVSVKYGARRVNNYRPYLLGGFDFAYDLSHEKETPIVFNHFDFGLHIALGCDTYLPFFKFCPELRFNLGLVDLLDHKRSDLKDEAMRPYTDALSSARNKSISLIFFFE